MNLRLMRWANLCLAAILLISFAGCKKDVPDTSDAITVDPSTLDFRRTENAVYVNLPLEPKALNPLMTVQGYSRYVHRHIIQTLNEIDPYSFAPVPQLADLPTVFTRPDGGVDYTFQLKENATWPDGSQVTADDVVFSLKILYNPLIAEIGPYRGYYNMIDGVKLTPADAKQIKISTNRPYILSEAALGSLPVYPKYVYDPDGLLDNIRLQDLLNESTAKRLADNNAELKAFAEQFSDPAYSRDPDKVVGSGPYRLVSWEATQKIRLERRSDYWADETKESWLANEPEVIEYQFISDATVVANALRDQEFDAVVELGVSQFRELRDEEQTAKYYNFDAQEGFVYYALMMNNQDPILADVKVRRALAHLTDVETIINNNYGELATRITNPILPQKPYYNQALKPIAYSVEQASSLLESAGWTDSDNDGILDKVIDGEKTDLRIELAAFSTEVSQDIALLLQQDAKAAGVEIEVATQDGRTLYGNLNKGTFQMATIGSGSEPIPDDLYQVYSTKSVPPAGGNRMRYGDAESDRMLNQIRRTLDENKSNELYQQLQAKIYEDQPMIYLFAVSSRMIVSKRFDAETFGPSPGFRASQFVQQTWNKGK